MKRYFTFSDPIFLLLFLFVLIAPGCLKDHCTHSSRYKVYVPVYQPLSEIRKAVKAEAPRELKQPGKIYYYQGYLFINEVNQGVHIIDNRNPAAPKNLAFINIPGNLDIAARGNILYADSYTDMVAIDISDPANIRLARRIKRVFAPRFYTYGFSDDPDGRGMITGFQAKDTVVKNDCDMQNTQGGPWFYEAATGQVYFPANMASKATMPSSVPSGAGGSMAKFTTYSHYLYTIKGSDSLILYDVSTASDPVLTNRILIGRNIETLFPYKHYLLMGASSGMFLYDVSNPATPVFKSTFMHLFSCDPVVAQDGYAYVTLRNGTGCRQTAINEMEVLDVNNVSNPVRVSTLQLTNPHGLAIDGNKLFVCDGSAGIRFIDITNKLYPKIIHTIEGVNAYDAIALNGVLIVVGKNGLYQYDYQDFDQPKLLSRINISH